MLLQMGHDPFFRTQPITVAAKQHAVSIHQRGGIPGAQRDVARELDLVKGMGCGLHLGNIPMIHPVQGRAEDPRHPMKQIVKIGNVG